MLATDTAQVSHCAPIANVSFDFGTRLTELRKEIDECWKIDSKIDEELRSVILKNQEIPRQMFFSLNRLKTQLALAESDSSQLSSMLSLTVVLAENVSGKVRDLDLAKGRVVDTLQRVEDILDLKLCTEGVQTAMQNEDYEQAAGHIHRFLTLDDAVLHLSAGIADESGLEGASSLKQSFDVLKHAEAELKATVIVKFDEAVACGDVASMERFFKIFPLLNQHDLGLEKFSTYLRLKIRAIGESAYNPTNVGGTDATRSAILFADSLTVLFEGIARVVEVHQPLVETYYGPERMLTLMQHLQKECDIHATRIIKEFVQQRQYDRKAAMIESYAKNKLKYGNAERLDPLELDVLLSEVTLMHTRAELYFRFVRRRVQSGIAALQESDARKPAFTVDLSKLLKDCELSRAMQILIGQYIAMEEYFMRESVKKAIQMDAREHEHLCSSMVDDVFFIVKKCIRRSLSSSSVDGVCAMLNHAGRLLEDDYRSTIHNRLKAGYPLAGSLAEAYTTAAAAYTSVMQQGKMPASGGDSAEKARDNFITALNNADGSREYAQQLRDSLWTDIKKHLGQVAEHDTKKLEMCLGNMEEGIQKFKAIIDFGFTQLLTIAVIPRLKPWTEALAIEHTHAPSEAEFADYEANDPFVKMFLTNLDQMLDSYKNLLTEGNYEQLLVRIAGEIAQRLEKVVLKMSFNRLGGLMFDKEVRDMAAYLANLTSWSVREKFTRLTQVAMLLNVETVDEVKELYNSTSIAWRLTPNEVRQVLTLRVDLSSEEVRRIKL